jgi:uncharacterized membrane protein
MSRWAVPGAGFVLGLLVAAAELGRDATPLQAVIAFVVVAGYALGLRLLQSRSETASLLSGMPADERWVSINERALSLAAQVMAAVLAITFVVTLIAGGDATIYTWLGATFALAYFGAISLVQVAAMKGPDRSVGRSRTMTAAAGGSAPSAIGPFRRKPGPTCVSRNIAEIECR